MSSNFDIARLIPDLMRVAEVQGAQSTLEKKLLGVIDEVLPKCDLIAARGLRDHHGAVLLLAIGRCGPGRLNALSKKWNPHREGAATNATPDQLEKELSKLVRGEMQPAVKVPKVSKPKTRGRRAANSAPR